MFLGAYHFDGDPTALAAAHDRLYGQYPTESLDLHVCVLGEQGIVVFDACPSRVEFTAFSQSPEFHAALVAFGLPKPRLEPLGEVHDVRVCHGAAR